MLGKAATVRAWWSQDGVAGGGASKGNWINNGKGKVVDRTRCRIAARGSKAGWRCPNPPMEGGGGLCAFHCKKPRLPGASGSTSAPASPGPAQRNATETVASTRQPRRIIKSSKLLSDDDSDGEQPGSTGWECGSAKPCASKGRGEGEAVKTRRSSMVYRRRKLWPSEDLLV